MPNNIICIAKVTPLLLSLRGMADDEFPHNQGSVAIANPLWKDILAVVIVVIV